jgi:hypothetical protein
VHSRAFLQEGESHTGRTWDKEPKVQTSTTSISLTIGMRRTIARVRLYRDPISRMAISHTTEMAMVMGCETAAPHRHAQRSGCRLEKTSMMKKASWAATGSWSPRRQPQLHAPHPPPPGNNRIGTRCPPHPAQADTVLAVASRRARRRRGPRDGGR